MKRWIGIYGLIAVLLGAVGYVGAIPPPPMGDHLVAADITYENLNANGDVGSGATQVAVGNHAHASYLVNPLTTLGDTIYGGAAGATTRLPGNTTSTKKFYSQTGTGAVSAAPSWEVVLDGDLPAALTGKSYNALTLAAQAVGFTIAGGTTSKTLTVALDASVSGTNTGDQTPADTVTTLDGTGTAGVATTLSRGDHEHSVTPAGIGAIAATEKAAASGVASLDAGSLVVQNPANATATPTASKIPIANVSGYLDAWISDGAITATKSAAVMKISGACVAIGDYSTAIGTGTKWYTAFRIPFKHTLDAIYLTTNEIAGSITIDIWSDAPSATTGLAALTDADSLFDTATEPAIADASSDNYFAVTSFDSGEAANAAGDWYVINVDAAATLTGVSVCFDFTRVD